MAFEQPALAKWNLVGSNDAHFYSFIGSDITKTINLGYAERTSNFTTTTTPGVVDVTSLSVSVTIPAGGRRLRVTASAEYLASSQSAGNGLSAYIYEDGVQIGKWSTTTKIAGYAEPFLLMARKVPSAGAHTYKLSISQAGAGTITLPGASGSPAYLSIDMD